MDRTLQQEVDDNYEAFKKALPQLLARHPNRWALMRRGEFVDFFDTLRDAELVGTLFYDHGLFSVQEVTERVADLGWFSRNAVP